MSIELGQPNTALDVISWRCDQLVHSGFALPQATQLANDSRFDLHALIELVEHGCPPELAVRILAPLEDGRDPA
jgi:hypothetical protein